MNNTITISTPYKSGVTVWNILNEDVKTYPSIGYLVYDHESEIREYLKKLDARNLKEKLAAARALRGDLLRRLEAVDKDIAGMTRGSDFDIDK